MTPSPSARSGPLLLSPARVGALAFLLGCAAAALGDAGHGRVAVGLLLVAGALLLAWGAGALGRRRSGGRVRAAAVPVPRRSLEEGDALAEANRMSSGGESSFRMIGEGGGRLVLMGGFDLDYAHDVELTFHDVAESGCPEELRWPQFADAGAVGERRRFLIEDDDGRYEVVARAVSAEVGRVYHYDRSALLPGERSWAGRAP